jgi:hypothetical protein
MGNTTFLINKSRKPYYAPPKNKIKELCKPFEADTHQYTKGGARSSLAEIFIERKDSFKREFSKFPKI